MRLEAAGRIARGDSIDEIARDLQVTPGSVPSSPPGNKAWLRVFQMPSYTPELNPAEGACRC